MPKFGSSLLTGIDVNLTLQFESHLICFKDTLYYFLVADQTLKTMLYHPIPLNAKVPSPCKIPLSHGQQ